MLLKTNSEIKFLWTTHSKQKLRQYRFSERRVLSIIKRPDRKEEGIAQGTIATMQITGTKKNPTEAWAMYVTLKAPKGIKIISTWRYPGRTPEGSCPNIPEDVMEELYKEINN
ncbi:MAG: hypothetical protein ABID67_00235 [Candidatus Nealsonbacteria bacterium]